MSGGLPWTAGVLCHRRLGNCLSNPLASRRLGLAYSLAVFQQFKNRLRVALNDHEIGAQAIQRARPLLLPIADLMDTETELNSKVGLRELEFLPDAFNIDFGGHIKSGRLGVTLGDPAHRLRAP